MSLQTALKGWKNKPGQVNKGSTETLQTLCEPLEMSCLHSFLMSSIYCKRMFMVTLVMGFFLVQNLFL